MVHHPMDRGSPRPCYGRRFSCGQPVFQCFPRSCNLFFKDGPRQLKRKPSNIVLLEERLSVMGLPGCDKSSREIGGIEHTA